MKNYEINKKIEKLIKDIEFISLNNFIKIVKIYLVKNCSKKNISDEKVWNIIEKMQEEN